MLCYCAVIVLLFQFSSAKICWEECEGSNLIESVDIEGCHRRSTYPSSKDFRCDGKEGPPCTVIRGETVYLDVTWKDKGHTNLTQDVVWQAAWMDIPWVGMETAVCKYVNNGESCPKQGESTSNYKFPIKIQEIYPAGYFALKWKLLDATSTGPTTAFCLKLDIKIV